MTDDPAVRSRIRTTDDLEVSGYLEVAEELNLQIIETVQKLGARFSGPGQQLTLHPGKQGGAETVDMMERILAGQQTSPDGV